jgi:hypothetical protein
LRDAAQDMYEAGVLAVAQARIGVRKLQIDLVSAYHLDYQLVDFFWRETFVS